MWRREGDVADWELRKISWFYFARSILVMIGVFAMRWNVVIGGQLFSKSLHGFKIYDMEILGREGVLMTAFLFISAFIVLYVLVRVLSP